MASFGFSIGDFISCLSLIRQVSQALKDSSGSVADYKSFLQTLSSLNQTLTTSELIYLQWQSQTSGPAFQANTQAMVNGMLFERQQCRSLMERFLKASAPYTDAFLSRRQNAMVRGWRKVTWLYQKDEISKLERDLQGHMQAMQVYSDALFHNQMASHTEAMDSQFQRLFSSVVKMSTDISSISSSLQTSQSRYTPSLGYPWEASASLAENVLLLDANGRSVLLPMLFLSSPKQFHELLNIMYRGIPGHRRILRKEYTITDEDSDGTLVEESNWATVIRAGTQLSLNMILQASPSWKTHHCPRCEEPTLGHALPGKRRRCQRCQLTYRVFDRERIVDEPAATSASSNETATSPELVRKDASIPSLASKQKDEILIREEYYFKRVHYHREIQITKPASAIVTAEQEARPLKVEELPPLHRAAAIGALAELSELLDGGGKIDEPLPFKAVLKKQDDNLFFGGCTPLHLAAFFGKAKAIEYLLDRGANLSAKDWDGAEPLHYTLTGEHWGAMFLLARGANPHARLSSGVSFLHRVCQQGIAWLLPPLLEYGADLTARDNQGCNSLHRAAYYGQREVVDIMLRQDNVSCLISALDSDGCMPFHCAVWNGNLEITTALLDKGANDSALLMDGRTPLHVSSYRGNYDVTKLLLERKCEMVQDRGGETPLHEACWNSEAATTVQLLLQNDADHTIKNTSGLTPLRIASSVGCMPAVKMLLEHGAETTCQDVLGLTPLHAASMRGHIAVVKLLLEGVGMQSLEIKDTMGLTPLLRSCWRDHDEVTKLLLSSEADVTVQDGDGEAPLHFAAWKGNLELVTIMLEKGADVDVKDNDCRSPLYCACRNNHIETARLLLKHGADIHTQMNQGRTPLHIAAWFGQSETLEFLLQSGADIAAQENEGDTPLHEASWNNSLSAAEILLANGAEVNAENKKGKTSLHFASQNGNPDVAEILLKHGANIEARDQWGMTPLQAAALNNKCPAIEVLLSHGADLNTQNGKQASPLHHASNNGYLAVVRELLQHGARATAADFRGETPLHRASVNGHLEIVRELVGHGGVDTMDSFARTSFHLACWNGHESVARFLIESGANINALAISGWSSLHYAMDKNHEPIAQMLLQLGIDPNLQKSIGETALHLAVNHDNLVVVQALVNSGVDLNVVNEKGETALHLACSKEADRTSQIVKLLLDNGADPSLKDQSGHTVRDVAKNKDFAAITALLQEKTECDSPQVIH